MTAPSNTTPANTAPLRLAVLCPHFAPDTAPTGDVMTRIVTELAALGHEIHVVTALPWYREHRIESGWEGRGVRRFVQRERVSWGSITRVQPFPGGDKRNILRRAFGFAGFSMLAGVASLRGGRVDAVIAMSPPLTLGLTGWVTHLVRRGPLIFNVQDVFPDAAVETGALTDRRVIAVARRLEQLTYRASSAVTVLSDDLHDNVAAKLPAGRRDRVRVIPNFVDVELIQPLDRLTNYRRELDIGDEAVVMYAGNVGFSQSIDLLIGAARELPEVTFVVNGDGAAKESLMSDAAGLPNVRFAGYQPRERLAEVLASADLHTVPLRAGLGNVSVPSKTYSILAAGRPVLAAIDPGTEVPRMIAAADAGRCVPPDDQVAFVAAIRELLADRAALAELGANGRTWVERAASPAAVASAYEALVRELGLRLRRGFTEAAR